MRVLAEGIRRVTLPLPLGIDHVHCYLLRAASGRFILVDTGLGLADARARWSSLLGALDAPLEAVVVTHMHPDHVGAARDVAELTGAPVWQGREDHAQCRRVWGTERSGERLARHWVANGMPEEQTDEVVRDSARLAAAVHWVDADRLLDAGDEVDGWRVELLRGHADGHIALVKDGVLVAGDALLAGITPVIGLYPEGRPDPLADYLSTLRRIEELSPRIAYAGHGEPIHDPVRRAREIRAHHTHRLDAALTALDGGAATAYEVSLSLFPSDLSPAQRRFAIAEALAHLERLAGEGRAVRVDGRYSAR